MTVRYFVETPIAGDRAILAGDEAHHLLHVMRAKIGEQIVLFDGSGNEFAARVDRLGRTEAELAVLESKPVDRELSINLVLAVALPKGDRQRWLVEKAVELGVSRLVPLETARGVAQPVDKALLRLSRAVIEASKQCGRNRLMEICASRPWLEYCRSPRTSGGRRWLADPSGKDAPAEACRDVATNEQVEIAIGPEGGWTDEELTAGRAEGWREIKLGERILRVETAALALVAIISAAGGFSAPDTADGR